MSFRLRYTRAARDDLKRLYSFLLERDLPSAERALDVIIAAVEGLSDFPFAARKVPSDGASLRELVIPFGSSGYIALFEIEDDHTVTILAVRHQREEDYR